MNADNYDEHAIRDLMARWRERAKQGDVDALVEMLAEDVVFLTHGNAPFGRKEFAAGFKHVASRVTIETKQEVKEIRVSGDMAYTLSYLHVTMTPKDGGAPMVNEGHALTVFRKEVGAWRLARDANLMPEAGKPDRV